MGEALRPEVDVEPVGADVDPLDQQLDDARLLGGEQLVPERIEPLQRLADVVFGQAFDLRPSGPPRGDDDLRRPQHAAQLVDDGGLDLGGRHAAHGAGIRRHASGRTG